MTNEDIIRELLELAESFRSIAHRKSNEHRFDQDPFEIFWGDEARIARLLTTAAGRVGQPRSGG